MITVLVTTNIDGDVEIAYSGNKYTFTSGSLANYLSPQKILVLIDASGKRYNFAESTYEFTINSVLWVGTFSALADEFNKNIFINSNIPSPPPGLPTVVRANAILTGAYVPTASISATGRQLLNVDFTITDGGALADSGNVIAILEVSDDNVNWVTPNSVVAKGNLHSDGAATPYSDGSVFRNVSAEIPAYEIPYDAAGLPPNPIRISFATGYGFYYRFQLRASVSSGIQGGAPATFPDLEITATLQ